MNFRIPNKQPKPVICVCGTKFRKEGIKPWHPYHDAACALKHKTGKVEYENLIELKLPRLMDIAKGVFCDYIKLRDKNEVDITDLKPFKTGDKINASHLFSCNQYPGLMFHEKNCFASKEQNNFMMDDFSIWKQTADNVKDRIDEYDWIELNNMAISTLIKNYKYSRPELIDYINLFTKKSEELKK